MHPKRNVRLTGRLNPREQATQITRREEGIFWAPVHPQPVEACTQTISFTIVVDDFGIKYKGKEHANHLMTALTHHYKIENN